jgi:hypothetical protein
VIVSGGGENAGRLHPRDCEWWRENAGTLRGPVWRRTRWIRKWRSWRPPTGACSAICGRPRWRPRTATSLPPVYRPWRSASRRPAPSMKFCPPTNRCAPLPSIFVCALTSDVKCCLFTDGRSPLPSLSLALSSLAPPSRCGMLCTYEQVRAAPLPVHCACGPPHPLPSAVPVPLHHTCIPAHWPRPGPSSSHLPPAFTRRLVLLMTVYKLRSSCCPRDGAFPIEGKASYGLIVSSRVGRLHPPSHLLAQNESCKLLAQNESRKLLAQNESCKLLAENESCKLSAQNEPCKPLAQNESCKLLPQTTSVASARRLGVKEGVSSPHLSTLCALRQPCATSLVHLRTCRGRLLLRVHMSTDSAALLSIRLVWDPGGGGGGRVQTGPRDSCCAILGVQEPACCLFFISPLPFEVPRGFSVGLNGDLLPF